MKTNQLKRIIAGTAIATMMLGVTAFAGTSYQNYNTTVGKFNGNGYSSFQTKSTSGANGDLNSSSVGGGYNVDVRMIDQNGNSGSWARNIKSGSTAQIDSHLNHTSGKNVRLQFSNDLTTRVDVQVVGSWRSN